ncbi:uncharacterized protein METZ01_LOCUS377229, partial [marine metagenome]
FFARERTDPAKALVVYNWTGNSCQRLSLPAFCQQSELEEASPRSLVLPSFRQFALSEIVGAKHRRQVGKQ